MVFGPECVHGIRRYERMDEDGTVSRGCAQSVENGLHPLAHGVVELDGMAQTGQPHRVLKTYRFNNKGPAQVASEAYRDGWDAIFAERRAPSGPN